MDQAIRAFTERLSETTLRKLACVRESDRAFDVALVASGEMRIVVRCVYQAERSDYSALEIMVAQGDFDRAALVYFNAEQPHLSDEIESWPISRIDELAASLARESRA